MLCRGGEAAPLAFRSLERWGRDAERSKKVAAGGEVWFGGELTTAGCSTGPMAAEEDEADRPVGWIVSHRDRAYPWRRRSSADISRILTPRVRED